MIEGFNAQTKILPGFRGKCGNTRLASYYFCGTLMRGMRWCDLCPRVVRKYAILEAEQLEQNP